MSWYLRGPVRPKDQTAGAITLAQLDQAGRIMNRSRSAVAQTAGTPLDVHAPVQYASITPALVEASKQAWMLAVGSRGLVTFRPDG